MRFAERIRVVGEGRPKTDRRALSSAMRVLRSGSECALTVLEVQPITWQTRMLGRVLVGCLRPLTTHPDVAERLEICLIRDDEGEGPNNSLDETAAWLKRYQRLPRGSIVNKGLSAVS